MLVSTFSKRVFNIAYQFTGSYEEAEDLTQEIFLKLHHSLPKYDFGKSFTAWFLTLAKNHLIDTYRRTKWEKKNRDEFNEHFHGTAAADSPESRLIREDTRKLVWDSLNQLSPDIRTAIIFIDIQGHSYEETAQVLGLPVGTVKSRVNRGRLQLACIIRDRKGGAA
jgi:RNA polymerase sigma-70 factor (ECF subfamily)